MQTLGVAQERKEGWRRKDRRGSCRGTAVVLTALNNAPKEEDGVAENTSIDDCGEGSTIWPFLWLIPSNVLTSDGIVTCLGFAKKKIRWQNIYCERQTKNCLTLPAPLPLLCLANRQPWPHLAAVTRIPRSFAARWLAVGSGEARRGKEKRV